MSYRKDLGYVYPNRSDEHMITVKHLRDTNFDENYPYLDKSLWFKIKRVILWVALNLLAFPVCTIRHGLKIEGRSIIKKHKALFKDGAITVPPYPCRPAPYPRRPGSPPETAPVSTTMRLQSVSS